MEWSLAEMKFIRDARSGDLQCVRDSIGDFTRKEALNRALIAVVADCPAEKAFEMLSLLLTMGASADAKYDDKGDSALHYAVCDDRKLGLAELLILHGATVEVSSSQGERPLYRAACGSPNCVKLLLDHGASVNHESDIPEKSPMYATRLADSESRLRIQKILARGAGIGRSLDSSVAEPIVR